MTTWQFCTSGAAVLKAGINRQPTISGAALGQWYDECEGSLEAITRKKWSDSYSNLPTAVQKAIGDVISSGVAKKVIMYDTTRYLAREADMLMNNNDDIERRGIDFLKDFKAAELKDISPSPSTAVA